MTKIKERGNVTLNQDYGDFGSGYVYRVKVDEEVIGNVIMDYDDAKVAFLIAVASTLPRLDGDCPLCGGETHKEGRGGKWNHRYCQVCRRCGWDNDTINEELIHKFAPKTTRGSIRQRAAEKDREDYF